MKLDFYLQLQQRHIDLGVAAECKRCPVALAVNEHIATHPWFSKLPMVVNNQIELFSVVSQRQIKLVAWAKFGSSTKRATVRAQAKQIGFCNPPPCVTRFINNFDKVVSDILSSAARVPEPFDTKLVFIVDSGLMSIPFDYYFKPIHHSSPFDYL